jgi:hypothetical protein
MTQAHHYTTAEKCATTFLREILHTKKWEYLFVAQAGFKDLHPPLPLTDFSFEVSKMFSYPPFNAHDEIIAVFVDDTTGSRITVAVRKESLGGEAMWYPHSVDLELHCTDEKWQKIARGNLYFSRSEVVIATVVEQVV